MDSKKFVVEIDGKDVTLLIKRPELQEINDANAAYAHKLANLVKNSGKKKLLLNQEVDKFIRDNGIWTAEDDKKVADLHDDIDELLNKMRKGGIKKSEGRKLAISIMDKRTEIATVSRKRQIFSESTIESMAENDRIDYLVYACTLNAETGEKHWPSFDEMQDNKNSDVYKRSYEVAAEVIFNMDYEKRLPENRWLLKNKFINEDLNYTDPKTGEFVDKEGNPILENQEKFIKAIENFQGEIVEEAPFLEDETEVETEVKG